MTDSSPDVVIVGGGIAGMTTAYYLAKSGVPSVVVERDAIGSHAASPLVAKRRGAREARRDGTTRRGSSATFSVVSWAEDNP